LEKVLKVEIITPVHNRRDLTLQFLKSLSRIDRRGLDVHVIIVDDGSTDGTAEAVRAEYPEVEIATADGTLWYTGGTNVGIEAALLHNPDYILAVNNDSIFEEGFLKAMVACSERNPRSVIGALLLNWECPHKVFQVAPQWHLKWGGYRHWRKQTIWTVPTSEWAVDIIVGNCVLYPTAAIREVGLMDDKRLEQFGDAEYTPRMRRRGWKLLIEPKARVFCQPNDIPPRLRGMGTKKKLQVLLASRTSPHSLRRRFFMNWYGAPTRAEGVAAFFVFFFRLAAGKNIEGAWAETVPEPNLRDIHPADSVSGSLKV
jgi:GT2 family glycosyltransferase